MAEFKEEIINSLGGKNIAKVDLIDIGWVDSLGLFKGSYRHSVLDIVSSH